MKVNARHILDGFGGMLAGAFGIDTTIGFLMGFIDNITPYQCYEFIRENKPLFPDVSDDDWRDFANIARKANLGDITIEVLVAEFQKYRPDLLSVVINHPCGEQWLAEQFGILKSKLKL